MEIHHFYLAASEREREELAEVYQIGLQISSALEKHVRYALLLEILENYDHRAWPKDFQLCGIDWQLQEVVMANCEMSSVDRRQRVCYLRLLMASKGRHKDIAYGLSERLLWRDKSYVIQQLIAMGKRTYFGAIPTHHAMENGVLHVAVSYKHTSTYCRKGTISERQANAIWIAVRSVLFVNEDTQVRVWIDQNLHRRRLPANSKWHEYGLLPYACLRTVFVGNGDFSLRLARTRPWLWVELITAMKADGIQSKPGYDFVEESDGIIAKMENYERLKRGVLQYGWLMGPSINVDHVMAAVTRIISLWRREDFMEHNGYKWATEFEEFVNWARRFVIRGIPYSQMEWNHSSDPVCGMDAVALLRSMPSTTGLQVESILGLARPMISWKVEAGHSNWVLGDLIDRSLVAELPLSELVEHTNNSVEGGEDLTIYGRHSKLERARFRRSRGIISMVLGIVDSQFEQACTKYTLQLGDIKNGYKNCMPTVTIETPNSDKTLMTYRPFTYRMCIGRAGRLPTGDACLRPAAVSTTVEDSLELQSIGICFNSGICEEVYTVGIDGEPWPLCTSEVNVLSAASRSCVRRFKALVKAMKEFHSYKSMKYKDMSEDDVLYHTRGRRVNVGTTGLNDSKFVSGEIDHDVEEELHELIRRRHGSHTLVWVDRAIDDIVQITFRGSHHITQILTKQIGTNMELAILEGTEREALVDGESTGLIQMTAGVQPEIGVKEYGSRINPRIQIDENGKEVTVKAINGIFSTCAACDREVCNINGLAVEVCQDSHSAAGIYNIRWLEKHACTGHEYRDYLLTNGSRIV